jgi:FkbM family methyltransferase
MMLCTQLRQIDLSASPIDSLHAQLDRAPVSRMSWTTTVNFQLVTRLEYTDRQRSFRGSQPRPSGWLFMMNVLKQLASTLPATFHNDLKRIYYRRQIKKGVFVTSEPEYQHLHSLIAPGDWVIDVGANVGHYTKRFSELVGPVGRVIAFEPVPETFALLSSNVQLFQFMNVTLINMALSDIHVVIFMNIPHFESGLKSFTRAHLTPVDSGLANLRVLTTRLDSLELPCKVTLVKIDVEGHELAVIRGMEELLVRDQPTLIVETGSDEVSKHLIGLGYNAERLVGSPNLLFRPASP